MEKRLREFDFIRAFAALSVIAIHVTAGYLAASDIAYAWNQAMRFAVPLFIILSGFLLFHADRGRPPLSYKAFLQKRLQKVLWPYLFWTILYVVFSERSHWREWVNGDILQPLVLAGKHLLKGTGYVHLYFVLIVLQLYVLYPFLKRWLERHASSLLLVSLMLTGFAQTMIYLHQIQVLVLPGLWIPYVSLFPIWLFYFVFGMAAAHFKSVWEEKLNDRMLGLAFAWLVSFVLLLLDSRYTQTHASSIKPSVMLYCLTSYFFFYMIALRLQGTRLIIGQWLDWLSTHSFMIFLLHPLLLSLLTRLPKLWAGTYGMVFLFLATTLCTAAVTYVLSFIPASTWIGGVHQKKKQLEQQAASTA